MWTNCLPHQASHRAWVVTYNNQKHTSFQEIAQNSSHWLDTDLYPSPQTSSPSPQTPSGEVSFFLLSLVTHWNYPLHLPAINLSSGKILPPPTRLIFWEASHCCSCFILRYRKGIQNNARAWPLRECALYKTHLYKTHSSSRWRRALKILQLV